MEYDVSCGTFPFPFRLRDFLNFVRDVRVAGYHELVVRMYEVLRVCMQDWIREEAGWACV